MTATLCRAVRRIRLEIEQDRQRVPDDVAALLVVIGERLADPNFDIAGLNRQCSPSDETRGRFRSELGLLPKAYLTHRRMQVAELLFQETDASVLQVARLLGYTARQGLARAYKKWSGSAPKKPGGVAEPVSPPTEEPAVVEEEGPPSLPAWRGLILGRWDPADGKDQIRVLRDRYPSPPRHRWPQPVGVLRPAASRAQRMAEAVWSAVRSAPAPARRALLCSGLRFESPALFHLLGRKAMQKSGREGVALAELALEMVEETSDVFGEALPCLRALGWARIGSARQRAGDYPGAEQAFAFCDEEWAEAPADEQAEAEISFLKASQRLSQRRFDEAGQLVDRAIDLFRDQDRPRLLARALVERVRMARHRGDPTIPLLEAAEELIDEQAEPSLLASTRVDLVLARASAGSFRAAARALPRARVLCQASGDQLLRHRLDWAEALVFQDRGDVRQAEALLRRARKGTLELGETELALSVALALAELYRGEERTTELLSLISEMLPLLGGLPIHREIPAAAKLLRSALDDESVSRSTLRRVRRSIDAITDA